MFPDLPTIPFLAGQSRFFTRLSRVPLNHGNVLLFIRSRIFFLRAHFVTLPRCPDVNANHPIEHNYGNSVRFLAKIPSGTAAESPCYNVFWNAIDFCRLYTSKKISMWALPTVPLFAGKSRFFTRNVPLKTFSRLAGLCFFAEIASPTVNCISCKFSRPLAAQQEYINKLNTTFLQNHLSHPQLCT